ncbi:PucR family transcriptional regulator [Sporosarcina sp. Marseille-Q4943]|uniref:PucR family transcriptional regulator n=1 Tax=Sporosarcina sp. Marseille-Q4943 TaxID=2942204 RepID=UPI00208DC335|nr:PucR family transcriptional regulator [Sporosarcina sp. Marseille-Q4943]
MGELQIAVSDILKRPLFKDAKVVAGEEGIGRQVKWAHVLEIQEFESLINGGELILTTGVGLQLDLPTQLKYVKRLIEKNVACICIELGPYFIEIPHEIIQLANEHRFPIIVFEKTVKFVDITQDLHTAIINRHHQMLSQLDALSRKFIDLSLAPNGILKILQELHLFFKQGIMFIGNHEKSYYYPSEMKEVESVLQQNTNLFSSPQKEEHIISIQERSFACMPVRGLGQLLGFACMEITAPRTDDMTFLILDRAALAIAQILLRSRTIAERKQKSEGEFVRNLLNGRAVDQDEIHAYLPTPSSNMYYRIFTIHIDDLALDIADEDWEEIRIQRSMTIRTLFNRHGFFPAVSSVKNEIVIIAFFLSASEHKKETDRYLQVLHLIERFNHSDYLLGSKCRFGIGTVYQDIKDIKKGYEESRKVLTLHKSGLVTTYFYEQLGIYRLLSELTASNQLQSFVDEHISSVIAYDKENDSELYETLCVYLECSGAKKETADRLFIVRQTLYHRLEKLEVLLGNNFMESQKRLAIEIAIHAYQFLKHSQST